MNVILGMLGRRRLALTMAALLALAGLGAWLTMNRQEDPFFPYRYGFVLVPYPGADVEQVERLVLDPLEEELVQVEEVDELRSTVRAGFAQTMVAMHQHVYDTDHAWDRVRDAVERARTQFPAGVGEPEIEDRQTDAAAVVLAVTGVDDPLALRRAAERLKRKLFQLDRVSRIKLYGDPGEQVTIAYDDATAVRLNLTPQALAEQLAGRNRVTPGGTVELAGRTAAIRAQTELRSIEELRRSPIRLPSGASMPLAELARVTHAAESPLTQTAWLDGERAVALAIFVPNNRINVVDFGQRLRGFVDRWRASFEPVEIREMFYQPAHTAERLAELGRSLLIGVIVVAAILFAVMGLRMGLVVAGVVPLVSLAGLAVYAIGGGVLHQMAIAGMVIALGMLVDNAIVMVENIQWHMDRGVDRRRATVQSVRELAAPLAAATGTTLAAFVPMLLSSGDTADFTRAIPAVVMVTLTVSYIFAVAVTPPLAELALAPRGTATEAPRDWGNALAQLALAHPWRVLAGTATALLLAGVLSGYVDKDFFPSTDRSQVVVDLRFPEGTHLERTTRATRQLGAKLRALGPVRHVYTFTGNSGPRFYYNLNETPRSPHIGRLVVETAEVTQTQAIIDAARAHARRRLPGVDLIARRLDQGPPVKAPVAIRVFAEQPDTLADAVEGVLREVRQTRGTVDTRHTLGIGVPSVRFDVVDAAAARHGVDRAAVAEALFGRTRGMEISRYRAGEDPVPIRLRSSRGDRFPADELGTVQVTSQDGDTVPVSQVATTSVSWEPAVIQHWDLQRHATVLSEVREGLTYADVTERLRPRLDELALPDGVRLAYGGDVESSGEANAALFRTLPVGGLLLLFFLLAQFSSFRRVAIVLVTVPLAAAGVVPGLLLSGQPFGFTAMLGLIALVGIVVNNAIVLLDVIDAGMHEGQGRNEAIAAAVQRRIRPILLTTATTIAGLAPLTLANSTLWPPMAWAIISGLTLSTALTLLVVPALCRLTLPTARPAGH